MKERIEDITGVIFVIINFLISLGLIIFNIYVFIQYMNGDTSLFTLSAILNILEIVFISRGKGTSLLIPLCIGSIIATKNIWNGICLALLLENVISYFLGIIYIVFFAITGFISKIKSKKTSSSKFDVFAQHFNYENFEEWKNEFYKINEMNSEELIFDNIEEEANFIAEEYGYCNFDEMYEEELKK